MTAQKRFAIFLILLIFYTTDSFGQSLVLVKSIDATTVQTGVEFNYILQYACAGTEANCENVIITDTIPDGLEFVSFTESGIHSSNTNYDPTTRIITFELNKQTGTGVEAGSTGEVLLRVRFPNGSTPDNLTVLNRGFIIADNAAQTSSDTTITSDATSPWIVNKTNNDGNSIFLDAPFTYRIDVQDATNGAAGSLNLDTFTVVDQLPAGAVFVSASNGGVYDGGAGTVTWTFGAMAINNSQSMTVTVTYPSSTFNVNDAVDNTVELYGQPVGEPYGLLDTDNQAGTLSAPNPVGTISKNITGNTDFILGDSLNYNFDISNTGSTALDTFFFTDTIPAELALYQIETGIYNDLPDSLTIRYQTNQNATWQIWPGGPFPGDVSATLNVGDLGLGVNEYISLLEFNYGDVPLGFSSTNDLDLHVYILNPDQDGQPVTSGTTVQNCGDLSYNFNSTNYTAQSCESLSIRDTIPPDVLMDKVRNSNTVPIGYNLEFILIPANTGDFPMDSIVMIDTIPVQMDLSGTESGGWTNLTEPVEVYYQTNLNGNYQAWAGSPYGVTSDTPLFVSNLSLAANEYVTVVKWVFRNPDRGFTHNGDRPRVRGTLMEIDRNGNPVNIGDVIDNCVTLTGYIDGTSYPHTDCDSQTAEPPVVAGDPDKRIDDGGLIYNGGPYFPGDTITYVIGAEAHSSSSDTLINPILMDLLPNEVTYIPDSWSVYSNTSGHPLPIFEQIPNYNNTSQTLLRWSWTGASAANFLPGQDMMLQFKVVIGEGVVAEQVVTNTVFQTTNDVDNFTCDELATLDIFDLDGDGFTADIFCYDENTSQFNIQTVASLKSEKLVKGACDTIYTKFPNHGQTVPGGDANYRLSVSNNGTVPMTNVVVIDILPYVGDMGVIDLSNRNTRWRPNLIAPLSAPAGVTVYYSTESNPCRDAEGIKPDGPAGCSPPNWSTIPPTDITTVQSLKIDFGDAIIYPGDELTVDWDMRAPVDILETIGAIADTIAWNSFGFIGTRVEPDGSLGHDLLPAEPLKVGIEVKPPTKGSYGNYVWHDTDQDGIQDVSEIGVNGVRVELYMDDGDGITNPATDSLINYTITTGNGLYIFSELDTANYYAVFYTPPTYTTSPLDVGLDTLDSDGIDTLFNGNAVAITPITFIAEDEQDLSWDLGIYQPGIAAVGNYVWFDENQNGLQDEAGSNGVNDITVTLYNVAGTAIDTTLTSNDVFGNPGYYLFDSIPPGDYYIEFGIPLSFGVTLAQQEGTGSDPTDSDAVLTADTTLARTDTFTLIVNQYDPNWDAGLILPTGNMSLGNLVWIDTNNSGDFDPLTESGVDGVKLNLYEDSNNDGVFTPGVDAYLTTTTTQKSAGKSGHYLFDNLAPGNYIVQVDASAFNAGNPLFEHSSSTGNGIAPDPDNNLNFDDNGEPLDGYGIVSQAVTLVADDEPTNDEDTDANSNLTVDFGFYPGNACGLFINDLSLNNCDENNGNPQFELNFDVLWLNAPDPQEDVTVTLNGTPLTAINTATAGSNGAQNYMLNVPADGATSEIQAYFATSTACGDTTTFTVNLGCPLKMIKTADTLTTIVGDTIQYTYQVINNYNEPIALSNITDDKIGEISTLSGAGNEVRVDDALQVLYRFTEGMGTTISDVSGVGDPIDLQIEGSNYAWDADTLIFNGPERASNTTDNNKIFTSATASNELTIEAWVTPANTSQSGPARFVTLSQDGSNRNFSMMQRATQFEVRLRTTTNGANGSSRTVRSGPVSTTEPNHVVFTRDAAGNVTLYINNVLEDSDVIGGDFSVWDAAYDFGIGNEFGYVSTNTERDWQGKFHLVAVYSKALSASEIGQNYTVGLTPPPTAATLAAGDTLSFTANYEVLSSDLPGPVLNEATIIGAFGDGTNTTVMDTASVNIICDDLTITQFTQNACDDNGTGSNQNDDFFTVTVNATSTGANPQYQVIRNLGQADELVLATENYGTAVTVGTGGELQADGNTIYTITVRDSVDTDCAESFVTTVVEHCSTCPPEICLPVKVQVKKND